MDSANLNQLADAILTALGGHNYLLAMSLALVVAVKGVRWLAPKLHDKTGALLNSDRGGALLSLLLSLGGGLTTALMAGKPVSVALLAKTLLVAATGSGLFNLTKRLTKPSDKAAPAATPPVSALLPLLLIPSLLLSGCTPAQTQAWKTAGIDALKCAGPSVVNAAGDALVDLMTALSNADSVPQDPKALGVALATKYGASAALCALGKAAADLLPAIGLKTAPTPRTKLLQGMLDTQNEWAK